MDTSENFRISRTPVDPKLLDASSSVPGLVLSTKIHENNAFVTDYAKLISQLHLIFLKKGLGTIL